MTSFRKNKFAKTKTNSNISPLTIYNPHTLTPIEKSEDGWLYGCFIDIGIRNMALRFSRCKIDDENDIMIEGLYQNKYDFDLSKGVKKDKKILLEKSQIGVSNDRFAQLLHQFVRLREHFCRCHYIVIERQIDGVAPFNVKVMNYTIGILTTLVLDMGNRPLIIEICPKQKSVPLGAPMGMSKSELKDWCYEKSIELLEDNGMEFDINLRNELLTLTKYGKKKRDDPADVICYCYVWWHQFVATGDINIPI